MIPYSLSITGEATRTIVDFWSVFFPSLLAGITVLGLAFIIVGIYAARRGP